MAGKHELSCNLLELLHNTDCHIDVITSKTENEILDGRESLKRKISLLKIKPLNTDYSYENLLEVVKQAKPDLFISAGYDKIIKKDILEIIPYCINIHFGLLPKYRGSYSLPWAIINNEPYIGVTLHKIDEGIDDGSIIFQEKIRNDYQKSCKDIYLYAVDKGVILVKRFYELYSNNKNIQADSQEETNASYYSPKFPNDYKIDWKQLTIYIYNYIRACHFPPYFPSFTFINGEKVGIEFPVKYLLIRNKDRYGKIIDFDNQFWITTLNGLIQPQKILIDSKRFDFQEFIISNNLIGNYCE